MAFRVMMIAGEPSGDLHGSGVVRELKNRIPDIDVFGVGGDKMKSEGMELVYHIAKLSFMGFAEVAKNLAVVKEVGATLELLLECRKPDVVVLIDYPGFNLRFAKKVKHHGIKVLYYISPQVWAWHKSRVKKMRPLVDRMKVLFPFEVEIYEKEGVNVEFVGHPLAERIGSNVSREEFFQKHNLELDKKLLGFFPGSRKQEIEKIFPTMIAAATTLQKELGVQVAVGVAPNLNVELLRKYVERDSSFKFVEHATYDLMAHADAAIVTSGTATLETGWFGTPMTVVYKTSPITYAIGRVLVDMPYIGLVNVVAGEKVAQEFIQHDMRVENLVQEVRRLVCDSVYANAMRSRLAIIKTKLGSAGASARVAKAILELGMHGGNIVHN